MDEALKNGLWNAYYLFYVNPVNEKMDSSSVDEFIWTEFLKKSITTFDKYDFEDDIQEWYSNEADWFEVYNFIEFCHYILKFKLELAEITNAYENECNRILEREMSAYRFIDGLLTRITSEVEIEAIETATQNSSDRWNPVTQHLRTALALFSNRQNPDYRNSVKESISAIESACKIITGDDKTTLGQALKVLENNNQIHPSLKAGFDKLYGYTSDKGGIRHAMLDSMNPVTFDEAKFMLVACSAFSNYLQPHLSPIR